MAKVLFLTNSSSGFYSFRRELVQALLQNAHEVVLCMPAADRTDYFRALGCHIVDRRFDRHGTNPLRELELLRFYEGLLRAEKPDIVFTYTIKPNVYGGMACQRLGVPYAANITGLGTAVENGGLMQKLTLALYRRGLRGAQKVFFQNTMNRDFMLSRGIVRDGQYDLLPGSGVNLEQYRPLPYPDGETVDFLFISRVMREKGIDQVLEAAELIRARHPETRFHICGRCEQDYEQRLRALEARGVIIYHGEIDDVSQMHRRCACTVHPSYYPEGMSNVLLESCACARPIITTARPGCGEIVDDSVNGFVVRERDSADLAEKLERFLSLPWEKRREMGLAGRAKVEKAFDRRIVVEKYLAEIAAVGAKEAQHAQTV